MARTCPQCQSPILELQRFCRYCGHRLDVGVQDYVETATLDQSSSSVAQTAPYVLSHSSWSPPLVHRTNGASRPKIISGIIALVLLCSIGVGGIYYAVSSGLKFSHFSHQMIPGVAKSYLGVYFGDDGAGGAFIDGIATEGSPADVAGLIGGDLIIEADGKAIKSRRDMSRLLETTPPGSQLRIRYLRDGQSMETVLVPVDEGDFSAGPLTKPHGFFGIDPNALRRVLIPNMNVRGVRLDRVYTNSPADVAGIREGDIVLEFGGHPIRTPRELLRRFRQTEPYSITEVKIVRQGEQVTLPVKMGRRD